MIVTITFNPAIDISYRSQNFQINQGHRVDNGQRTAGGKGINVSRVLKQLGHKPLCTGFLGGHSGSWIKERLSEESLDHEFVEISGDTRTCIAILDEQHRTQTELLEKGPHVTEDEKEMFLKEFSNLLKEATLIIASGSLPRGLPADIYRIIGEMAQSANIPFILDTSGEALKLSIEGKPFLIKPNKEEICQYAGKQDLTLEEMITEAKKICSSGIKYVLISLGAEGAILVGNNTILHAKIPEIPVVNPVGSGDSMVAAMAYALQKQYSLEECLRWACACGMSNAMEDVTGTINLDVVQKLLDQIEISVL